METTTLDDEDDDTFTFRQMTTRGDLIMVYKGRKLSIDATLGTDAELARLKGWAAEFDMPQPPEWGLIRMEIDADPEKLKNALEKLIEREVGDAGYFVYEINKKGRGRVLQGRPDISKARKIVKSTRTSGG